MKKLALKFEKLVEGFLKRNLEGHTRILSWTILILLAACVAASAILSKREIILRNADGTERRAALVHLLLGSQ
ncbi:MAG TPA: hypothetical protein VFX30_13185 [bacterium]|nr:hypothetical protein [bacterium]